MSHFQCDTCKKEKNTISMSKHDGNRTMSKNLTHCNNYECKNHEPEENAEKQLKEIKFN